MNHSQVLNERLTNRTQTLECAWAYSVSDLPRLQRKFSKNHMLHLPQVLVPEFLADLHVSVKKIRFQKIEYDVGTEEIAIDSALTRILAFHLSHPAVLKQIQALTSCPPLAFFAGRIYRMRSHGNHSFRWHNDMQDGRSLGLSLNLSPGPYAGGDFEIRKFNEAGTTFHNSNFSDAIVFRIASDLQHRVTPITKNIKISLAGWFFRAC